MTIWPFYTYINYQLDKLKERCIGVSQSQAACLIIFLTSQGSFVNNVKNYYKLRDGDTIIVRNKWPWTVAPSDFRAAKSADLTRGVGPTCPPADSSTSLMHRRSLSSESSPTPTISDHHHLLLSLSTTLSPSLSTFLQVYYSISPLPFFLVICIFPLHHFSISTLLSLALSLSLSNFASIVS